MTVTAMEGFPHFLLDRAVSERRKYFEDYAVAHTVLDRANTRLMSSLLHPGGKRLIFVIGPPGAGKTFLLRWTETDLQEIWARDQHMDRGRIPVVGIEAPARDMSKPSCKDIYLRVLRALEEPLIDKKIIHGDVPLHRDADGQVAIDARITTFRLRYALEQALKHRRPFALFIDEAQHLFNIAGLPLRGIMDWVKSLANMTGVVIVLCGTYEMFELLDLSDQLLRRSLIIHLRRYGNSEADQLAFVSVINAFQKNMPLPKEPDLLKHWRYLYERTAGCVGNLYDWLVQAYHLTLNAPRADTLTLQCLQSCAPLSAKRAATMSDNIARAEINLIDLIGEDEAEDDAENNLIQETEPGQKQEVESPETTKPMPAFRARRRRVGERKPVRDKTGDRQDNV